jgi:hypothetical protein
VGLAVAAASGHMVHVLWNQLSNLYYAQQELDQSANSPAQYTVLPLQPQHPPRSVVYALFLGISSFLCAV